MKQFKKMVIISLLAGGLPVTAVQAQTLQKIQETGTITIGHREASIPFSYLDAQQNPIGMSMDLCQAIVQRIQTQLSLPNLVVNKIAVNSSNRIPLVKNGTVDIVCGSTANNSVRQREVSFSVATFVTQPMWLVRNDAGIKTVADLKGKTVVTTQGSNAVGFARQVNDAQNLGMAMIQAKDHGESQLTLESGRAVAWLEDDILLAGIRASSRQRDQLSLMRGDFENIYYGLIFRKDDTQFKALVDDTLSDLMRSGEFTRLYRKWYESPIPPNNINLQFPITAKLMERIQAPSDRIDE